MIGLIFLCVFLLAILVYAWVKGIDSMRKNHPDYKGEDFLNWDKQINNTAGRDGWDENLYDEIY